MFTIRNTRRFAPSMTHYHMTTMTWAISVNDQHRDQLVIVKGSEFGTPLSPPDGDGCPPATPGATSAETGLLGPSPTESADVLPRGFRMFCLRTAANTPLVASTRFRKRPQARQRPGSRCRRGSSAPHCPATGAAAAGVPCRRACSEGHRTLSVRLNTKHLSNDD